MLKMFESFGEQQRGPPFMQGTQYVCTNHFIARIVISQCLAESVEFDACVLFRRHRRMKTSRTNQYVMGKRPACRLFFCIYPVPERTALHENNWMMAVFTGNRCRQACDKSRFGAAYHQFKAAG